MFASLLPASVRAWAQQNWVTRRSGCGYIKFRGASYTAGKQAYAVRSEVHDFQVVRNLPASGLVYFSYCVGGYTTLEYRDVPTT